LIKCFDLLRLPLAPLTLLSGANASGKSSVLQALVLLHQTMREHEWSMRLMLNGGSIRLGTVVDVVDKVHGRHTFEIGLVDGERTYTWSLAGEQNTNEHEGENYESRESARIGLFAPRGLLASIRVIRRS